MIKEEYKNKNKYMKQNVIDFLEQSNLIESVGVEGMDDSVKAYEYLMAIKAPLTKEHLLEIHRLVLKTLKPSIAGKIRKGLVMVGGRYCPPAKEIPEKLERFFELVNHKRKEFSRTEKEVYCKLTHIDFEKMHPFMDGNGRVGRLILNWQRKQMGLPLLIIQNNRKYDYYNWFL